MKTRPRVLVAMSGGVDSSVAAALLARQGYDVVGATMKLYRDGEEVPDKPCCSLDSVNDARRVAERIGIPHYVINLEDKFGHDVVDDFVAEYARGRTPIPCVHCNTFTKFRDLVKKADAIDATHIATGHYARMVNNELHRGVDDRKDQTYFLWGIDRSVLWRMLLPIGHLTKPETREIARELGMTRMADKPESQEICFVPDGNYAGIIEKKLGADTPSLSRGPIITSDGTVVGEHDGFARYTIGQRRGVPGGYGEPMYVVAIRAEDRAVVIGPREELLGSGVIARGVTWLVDPAPMVGDRIGVRVRHRSPIAPAEIVRVDGHEVEVALDEPVAAIAPGQSLVMYSGDKVLGGGFIEASKGVGRRKGLPVLAG
jgi:tRNA-specific 2-thiouridylase